MSTFVYATTGGDSERKRLERIAVGMGHERPQVIQDEAFPHMLARVQSGDTLILDRLADVISRPSEVQATISALLASGAEVYVADVARHAPISSFAPALIAAARAFEPLEQQLADVEHELETVNERSAEFLEARTAAIADMLREAYGGTPRGLLALLIQGPPDLRKHEPLGEQKELATILERARQARGLSMQDLADRLGISTSQVHRALTAGKGGAVEPIAELLMAPSPLPGAPANGSLGKAAGLVGTPEPREGEAS